MYFKEIFPEIAHIFFPCAINNSKSGANMNHDLLKREKKGRMFCLYKKIDYLCIQIPNKRNIV